MIRRLGVILVLVISVIFFFGVWMLRHSILQNITETTLSQLFQAPVTVESLKFNLLANKVNFSRLSIRNKNAPDKNLLVMHEGVFEIALWPLLHNKLIIRNINVDGVIWGDMMEKNTQPPSTKLPNHPLNLTALQASLPQLDLRALQQALNIETVIIPETLTSVTAIIQSESDALTDYTTWLEDFKQRPIKSDMKQLRNAMQQINLKNLNGIKDVNVLQQKLNQLIPLQDQAKRIHVNTITLQHQAKRAFKKIALYLPNIQTLTQNDIDTAKQQTHLGNIDIAAIAEMVLGEAVLNQINHYFKQFHQTQRFFQAHSALSTHPQRMTNANQRGTTIHFPSDGRPSLPNFVLNQATFSGVHHQRHRFSGSLSNWSSDAQLYAKPTHVRIALHTTAGLWHINATFDHSANPPIEQIEVIGENIILGRLSLKSAPTQAHDLPDQLLLPQADIIVKLTIQANALSGEMILHAQNAKFVFTQTNPLKLTDPSAPPQPWHQSIPRLFTSFDQINLEAKLTGTLQAPQLTLSTNFDEPVIHHIQALLDNKTIALDQQIQTTIKQHVQSAKKSAQTRLREHQQTLSQMIAALISNSQQLNREIQSRQNLVQAQMHHQANVLKAQAKQKLEAVKAALQKKQVGMAVSKKNQLPIPVRRPEPSNRQDHNHLPPQP